MKLNNHGLTVGELTIAIALIIVISFVWSTVNKKQESTQTSFGQNIEKALTNKANTNLL